MRPLPAFPPGVCLEPAFGLDKQVREGKQWQAQRRARWGGGEGSEHTSVGAVRGGGDGHANEGGAGARGQQQRVNEVCIWVENLT